MEYSSKLIEEAVHQISKLPGIGRKTALRLALHLLKEDESYTAELVQSMIELRTKILYCSHCHNISDSEICRICSSHRRDRSLICVVEDSPDVIAIENTAQFQGLYHVLGGLISPLDGIGPDDLFIEHLVERISASAGEVKEIIMALSPNMEGDTTAFYLTRKLKDLPVRISTIARGIPIGGELEYADEITLGRSILTRTIYKADS
jgi:recombination protein RecR